LASILSVAIIIERLYSLRQSLVAPAGTLENVIQAYQGREADEAFITELNAASPLGQILAAGLKTADSSRELMKESIEETGRAVAHDLDRFMTTLGTIAAMAPLLGLLGTVVGMIEIFGSQAPSGANPQQLAQGISVALYNTAFGLIVAIPSMIFYRHFRAKVDALVVGMEQQAIRLVDTVHTAGSSRRLR
jgi:biopolymer transport protein ExbB